MSQRKMLLFPQDEVSDRQLSKFQTSPYSEPMAEIYSMTDDNRQFLFWPKTNSVQELQYCNRSRSTFCGNVVLVDGGVYIATAVDPLYLVLFCLSPQHNQFRALDDIFTQHQWVQKAVLHMDNFKEKLDKIADMQMNGDKLFLRANEEKICIWLEKKVERIALALDKVNSSPSTSQYSSNFQLSGSAQAPVKQQQNPKVHEYESVEILGEYLPAYYKELLYKKFSMEETKQKLMNEKKAQQSMKSAAEFDHRNSDTSDKKRGLKKETAKVNNKKPKNVASKKNTVSGMKSIASFFQKK